VREPAADHGMVAEYASEDALVRAIERVRALGYVRLDALTPYPSERVIEALSLPRSPLPPFALAGALVGGASAYAIQYWTRVIDFPLDVGGKPLHAWPAFVPITFELTILGACAATFVALFWLCRLPRLAHPLFAVAATQRASDDGFFLVIAGGDSPVDPDGTREHLAQTGALSVHEWGPDGASGGPT
jgi:hypothetical protein